MFVVGSLGNMEVAMIHCLNDIINMALLSQRLLEICIFCTEQRMSPVLCISLFFWIFPSQYQRLWGWGLLGYVGLCSNLSFDVMKCAGRYFGWYWLQLRKTFRRGCQIASMCGFLRLPLPLEQLTETLGRLAREFATTDSDIDRRGGAPFFESSHTEISVFRALLPAIGYNMNILCITNVHLSKN